MAYSLLNTICQEAAQVGGLEWLATITALIYVVLAARESLWCWHFGIISCAIWAYITFSSYQLYLDAILNVFYVIMGFVGIYQWKFGAKNKEALAISQMTSTQHLQILTIGSLAALLFGYYFDEYTPAAATYLDAFTTMFAIVTTFLVIQKKLENWLYWIVIDTAYIYLYASRGAYLFMLVYAIYVVIAVVGYFRWRKVYKLIG